MITEALNMAAIHDDYRHKKTVEFVLQAGVDHIMRFNVEHYQETSAEMTFETIYSIATRKKISEKRINRSFQRIMTYKSNPAGQ